MDFFEALSFGFYAVGLLVSFILICFSIWAGRIFWRWFKSFAKFGIKIENLEKVKKK